MAMLAEKKSKQKWSHDPRNKTWSTDTDRFGYQMLTKMGWSAGKGLGAAESGSTSHVKISLKNNNLGVGAKASHEDNWLAHQEDFNDLLAQLNRANSNDDSNEDNESNMKKDMETIARNSKKRVFYQRFIKSKNTSSYSSEEMACIMGQRSKSAPQSPIDLSENEDSNDSCASCPVASKTDELGLKTVTSGQSIQEYFAMKMAELKEKRRQENGASEEVSQTTSNNKDEQESSEKDTGASDDVRQKKEKKSKKRRLDEDEDSCNFTKINAREDESQSTSKHDEDCKGNSKKDKELSPDGENQSKKKKKTRKRKLSEEEVSYETSKDTSNAKEEIEDDCKKIRNSSDSNDQKKKNKKKENKKKENKKKEKKRKLNEDKSENRYDLGNSEEKMKGKSEEKAGNTEYQQNLEESCKEKKKQKRERKRKLDEEECSQNTQETKLSKKMKKAKIEFVNIDNEDIIENENERKEKRKNKKEKQYEDSEIKVSKDKTKKKKSKR